MGFEPEPSKKGSWMMAQNDLVVAGIDVAKDKIDVCIRSLSLRRTFASTAEGHRELVSWLRRRKVGKAVMEASGGYEREWAKALRAARIEVRIVDPKRVRSFAQSAGRLAKNDTIDAEMIAWFAETFDEAKGQVYDAAREKLHQMVNARQALKEMQAKLQNQGEHAMPAAVEQAHARVLKTIGIELAKLDAAISAMIRTTRILPSLPRSWKAFRALVARPLPRSLPPCRSSARPATRSLRPCWASPLTMTTAAGGEVSATSRADVAGPAMRSIWPAWGRRRSTTPC